MSKSIVLIGPMGAGKSSVGAAVADLLKREFIDTDVVVEREAGMTIREIFEREGEESFRGRERDAVMDAAGVTGAVIACGGGAILDETNLRALRDSGSIVYLRVSPETAARRVSGSSTRPLLKGAEPLLGETGGMLETLRKIITEREDKYRDAADYEIDADGYVSDVARAVATLAAEL